MKKALLGVALAFVVLSVVGGYGFNWKWTGFSGNGTVWDWMNLFLLPITLGLLPFAFELSTAVLLRVSVALAVPFAVLLIGGYGLGWSWTGFAGNTLWDWLHLLLVPVALSLVSHELGERQKRAKEAREAHAGGEGAAERGRTTTAAVVARHD